VARTGLGYNNNSTDPLGQWGEKPALGQIETGKTVVRFSMSRVKITVLGAALSAVLAGGSLAAERGSVTNLPIPRFVSLKASEGNVRRGPSLSHRIDWVFKRRHMPLEVTGEFGHWRRVRDRDGAGGWVHYSLLSGMRTVIVEQDMLPMLMRPDPQSQINAHAEIGVVARLGECAGDWCRITAERHRGWVPRSALWGVRADETRD